MIELNICRTIFGFYGLQIDSADFLQRSGIFFERILSLQSFWKKIKISTTMQTVTVKAQERSSFGKSSNNSLRKEGRIPAVIYSKDSVKHCSVTEADLKHLVYTPDFKLAEVEVAGSNAKCTLQDIQFHPVTDNIVHVDFLELVPGHALKVNVPVRFKGVSPGVKGGGKLMQSLRKVKIKCTPENIVQELFVDISELELGFAVRIRDLELPDGIEVMTAEATPIASVEIPRALKTADDDADDTGAEAPAAEEAVAEEA